MSRPPERQYQTLRLDQDSEYAPAFADWAEVLSQRNMQLADWLLTFEELIEVLTGNSQERKAEVKILQELIPLARPATEAHGATERWPCGAPLPKPSILSILRFHTASPT